MGGAAADALPAPPYDGDRLSAIGLFGGVEDQASGTSSRRLCNTVIPLVDCFSVNSSVVSAELDKKVTMSREKSAWCRVMGPLPIYPLI